MVDYNIDMGGDYTHTLVLVDVFATKVVFLQ